MNPTDLMRFAPWQQFGLMGAMVLAFIYMLSFFIRWAVEMNKEILKQAAEERKASGEIINRFSITLAEHTAQSKEFCGMVVEAHRYQRDEHKKMIDNLDEQGKVLARINGYKP